MARSFAIVFVDATDTLIRVRGTVGAIYAEAAARFGLAAPAADIDAAFRAALASAPPPVFPPARPSEHAALEKRWWRDIVARTFAAFGPFPRFETFFDDVFEAFRDKRAWELLPGATEALRELRRGGRRLGIVSDMDGRLFDLLDALELGTLFDPIVLSTRMGRHKRDGGLFPLALDAAGVESHDAVHVGDGWGADVQGARSAGIQPIWFGGRAGPTDGVPAACDWSEVLLRIRELENERR